MDFEVVAHNQTSPYLPDIRHGSLNLKRSGPPTMPKPAEVDFSSDKTAHIFTALDRSSLWPDDGQKMLSFSSFPPRSAPTRSIAFSISQDDNITSSGGGGLNGGARGGGTFTPLKGPFTPSQWMELEHQALIYKHIVANVPVPSHLLTPIKRALYSYGSTGSYPSNFLGLGPFHLGFSGSNDPEPGRCRRTDGKKWRCSRDAVPDQKYCERHINRGRHRSRKPVEGQTGHAVSGSTQSKVVPVTSSSPASVISSTTASNSLGSMPHQFSSLIQPNTTNSPSNHFVSRSQGLQGLSLIPPTASPKSKDASFLMQKQQNAPFNEISHSEFGSVPSDSLLNPTERISFMNTSNSDSFLRYNAKEANNQQPVHHFIDDWPKDQSDRAPVSWPEELKSDWTQLSMSIPMAPDFSSSSSSPAQEKPTVSTLRLSHEHDPTHMSLGASHYLSEPIEKQSTWSPVIWGNLMGGPLGEVLTTTTNAAPASLSSLRAWKSSHQLGSSPTGVLQKSTFVSLSNSSSGSSPVSADSKKAPESVSLCNDVLGSALVSSAAIPSL